MQRRLFLSGVITMSAVGVAGCSSSGDNDTSSDDGTQNTDSQSLVERAASEIILSNTAISSSLPGDWEFETTRPPEIEPVGLESIEIKQFLGETEADVLDYAVAVFDTVDNASTFIDDTVDDSFSDENVGDEAYSTSNQNFTAVLVRERNMVLQITGSSHISNLRTLGTAQIEALSQ